MDAKLAFIRYVAVQNEADTLILLNVNFMPVPALNGVLRFLHVAHSQSLTHILLMPFFEVL